MNFKFCSVLFSILTITAISVTPGCSGKRELPPIAEDTVFVPYQEFGKSTIFLYDGALKQCKLDTDFMRKTLDDSSHTLVVPVRLLAYDSSGEVITRILADSGYTVLSMDSFFIWGNVDVKRVDKLKIKSESLWLNRSTHKVGSDDFVEITTPAGDVMRGKGLDATESFSEWTLRQSVSGKFPNFRARMESDEIF